MLELRRRGRLVVALPLALGAALLTGIAGSGVAAERAENGAELVYTCGFPAGEQRTGARISASFPAGVAAGEPIRPEDVAVALTVPAAALADLGAASVEGRARLTVAVGQGETVADAVWSDLSIPTTPVPEAAELALTASGAVPPVTADESGEVTFAAAGLELSLVPRGADGAAIEADPLPVACAPGPDGDTRFGAVPVSGAPATSAPGGAGSSVPSVPSSSSSSSPDDAGGGLDVGSGAAGDSRARPLAVEDAPPGCFDMPTEIANPTLGCAYLTGYSNVEKLNGAVRFGVPEPGFLPLVYSEQVRLMPCEQQGEGYICQYVIASTSRAQLDLPAADSSLVAFDFVPVAAKVKLTLAQPDIVIDSRVEFHRYPNPADNKFPVSVVAPVSMWMQLSEATVNGVALDVGPDCRTAEPVDVELTGGAANNTPQTPDEYTVADGGVLTGIAEIPGFSGCGVSEDLDPLLTGTISGPGNYVKMTQGEPCMRSGTGGECPPEVREPRR
ncbi:DUF6801 domain-containing protein [Qaidamihabitans albus]|uniref:DUF6801 domain-containing protein n=1 Tax=Qaidamihabitans albus TaxID=2795733 RepID=UPI0018F25D2F|nr:DUF6801 domain-containing protein [Qaidamihabitans albus]